MRSVAVLVISGFAGATLVRIAPGFGLDEQALDPRLSSGTLAALQRERAGESNVVRFYAAYLGGLLRGDAGKSVVFNRPVLPLIAERASTTVHTVFVGLTLAWLAAVPAAIACVFPRRAPPATAAMAVISGSLLSIPSAVVATLCLLFRLPPSIAVAAVVFPRVFPHAHEQFRAAIAAPHVLVARARGISPSRLFFFHVAPSALLPLLALAGVSVTLAFGASIPIEAISDSPGLGQLAWRAATGRDVPVLVSITLMLTAATVIANALADFATMRLGRSAA